MFQVRVLASHTSSWYVPREAAPGVFSLLCRSRSLPVHLLLFTVLWTGLDCVGLAQETALDYDAALQEAQTLIQKGEPAAAVALLEPLCREYDQDPQARLRLAFARFLEGDYEQALDDYRAVLKLSPESVDGHLGAGWSLLRLGRNASARQQFLWVSKHVPGYSNVDEGLSLTRPRNHVTQWMQFITYRPPVVLVSPDGKHGLLRRGENLDSVLEHEEVPAWLAEA